MIRPSRAATAGTLVIALGSFVLSFVSLSDLSARHGVPAHLSWVMPLIVDSMVLVATLAVVALHETRWFAWLLLASSAAVSVAGNVVHAAQWGTVGMVIAAVPPIVLLGSTHLCVLLARPAPATAGRGVRPFWVKEATEPGLGASIRGVAA